jgi:hypothetical protein
MAVYSASALDAVYIQGQTVNTPRTIANLTGAKTTRHQSCTFTENRPVTQTPFKTGTRSNLVGIAGRTSATFSWTGPLIPNGVTLTDPDTGMFFKSAFGVAIATGVYALNDTGYYPFALARFNKSGGSSPTNQICGGCLTQRLTITGGGEHLMMTVEGRAVAVCDSTQFASYTGNDAVSKFTLGAFPSEPTPSIAGTPINGFGGTATFDSNSMAGLRGTWSITINTGLDFADDGFSDGYPFAIVGGKRSVSLSNFHFIDDDSTALNNVKTKAFTKSAIDVSIAVNNVVGSTVTIAMKSVQLNAYQIVENGNAFDVNFGDSMAHATAAATIDDCTITFG